VRDPDLGEESPPLPVPKLQVGGAVALDDADRIQLVQSFLEVSTRVNMQTLVSHQWHVSAGFTTKIAYYGRRKNVVRSVT